MGPLYANCKGGQSGSGCGDVGRSLAADRSCGQLFREYYRMTLIDILRDFAANNGTDVEITVTVSDPANARITGTLVECEEDFVKLVNVRPYAALDRYVAIQHIVWVNRQPR